MTIKVQQSFERRLRRKGIEPRSHLSNNNEKANKLNQLKGLPFWIWDKAEHQKAYRVKKGKCCFNHSIPVGLPEKNGVPKPMFPYEKTILDALMTETGDIKKDKHVYVLKSTGLGVTEFCLRWIAWMCLKDDKLKDSQAVIITGPRIELAITLINRLKGLFPDVSFAEKETVCTLNSVRIEAFPSHTGLDSARGLKNPTIIMLDESDFFPVSMAHEARAIAERYIGKSGPYILLVSTPNRPEGLMDDISKEPEDKCLYHRIFLPYTVGLGLIYTEEEIAAAKASPQFQREYNLQFIGEQGTVFIHETIERAIQLGLELEKIPNCYASISGIRQDTHKSMGVDPGFGSSKFAILVSQLVPGNKHKGIEQCIQVLYAEEFERPSFSEMIDKILNIYRNFVVDKIYIDSANPEIITAVKTAVGDRPDYERQIANLKTRHPKYLDLATFMNVIPKSFGTDGREMLAHTKARMDKNYVAIHPSFHRLIIALRTAVSTDGLLSKQETSHDDLLDAFRLSLCYYK